MAAPAASASGEAAITPPPPGMLAMPPRTTSAQAILDYIIAAPAATALATATDMRRLLRLFADTSVIQLSPIQLVWQCGEFIRDALEIGRVGIALDVTHWLVQVVLLSTLDLVAGPGRADEMLARSNNNDMQAASLTGANELLFLACYMPLCPDLGASLNLFQLVVRTIRSKPVLMQQLTPGWLSHILQVDGGRFYIDDDFPPLVSTWFHVMRRDHTLAAAKWLFGPERPLPFTIVADPVTWVVVPVRDLACMPPAIADLALDAILHTQTRGMLVRVRTTVMGYWQVPADAQRALARIDQHLAVHAPPTVNAARPAREQAQVMNALVEQMARTTATDVPFDVASMVMDYVRHDESVRADTAKLTPYKQTENDYLRARIGAVGVDMAAERVATAAPRATPVPSRPREEEEETQQQQQRARLNARFLSPAPAVHW